MMLLYIVQFRQPLTQRMICSNISIVLRLRNPGLI